MKDIFNYPKFAHKHPFSFKRCNFCGIEHNNKGNYCSDECKKLGTNPELISETIDKNRRLGKKAW